MNNISYKKESDNSFLFFFRNQILKLEQPQKTNPYFKFPPTNFKWPALTILLLTNNWHIQIDNT